MQPVSLSARRIFSGEATWGGLVPSLVREYRYDSAGNVSGHQPGRLRTGNTGSTGWTGTARSRR
ncbi:hypothetical protein H6S10_26550 (plasmid) [Escherichia coli]|nr:hypothetical protein H6S10_26550 [Escherichia coli]